MGLMDDVLGSLGSDGVGALADSLGLDPRATQAALSAAVPLLLGGLSRSAARSGGADSLLSALDRDHDGSVLDDIAGFLGGNGSEAGGRIVGHTLGTRRSSAEQAVSRAGGIDLAQAGKLLAMAAPLVMGALGRAKQQKGLDARGLNAYLDGDQQALKQKSAGGMELISRLLDADHDGSVLDDLAGEGAQLLSAFMH